MLFLYRILCGGVFFVNCCCVSAGQLAASRVGSEISVRGTRRDPVDFRGVAGWGCSVAAAMVVRDVTVAVLLQARKQLAGQALKSLSGVP